MIAMSMFIDHLVFMVKDVGVTEAFYTSILGRPLRVTDDYVVYDVASALV